MALRIWTFLLILFSGYSIVVYRYADEKPATASAHTMQGFQAWQENNCASCHQLYGLGGYLGPDLTNVAAKGEDYIKAFLKNGTSRMPDLHLKESEINSLVSFLQWVDSSGTSEVQPEEVHWTGTYVGEKR